MMIMINNKILEQASNRIKIEENENKIGVLLGRSKALISTIYSCFCNELTYIPLDVNWPKERLAFVLHDSKIETVITNHQYSNLLNNVKYICVNDNDIIDFDCSINNNDIAYTLYTSGLTGNPKGVEITRESLFNFIEGISEIIDFTEGKKIACITTVSFDIFFLESIMALKKGLTVILANEDEQTNPKLMGKFIKDNNIDMIQMTPSSMQLLINNDKELLSLKNVKEIMIGGESFPLNTLRFLQERTTAKIYNMYGPTETTIWSTVSDLTSKDRIDIGYPIKNTEVYIVDENFFVVTNGQAGEICISGKGLAKRYVNRESLTVEKFIYLPQKPDTKVYRTGDIGRFLSDGSIEFLGRTDNQVKVRGHRIELEEIETHINQFVGINQSIVITVETSNNDKILQAFYTSNIHIDSKNIIKYLSLKLPLYMIPVIFTQVENFIQTFNGKIDRKKVMECIEIKPEPVTTHNSTPEDLNEIQKKVMTIIKSNFEERKLDKLTLNTDLSSIGIDSISLVKLVVAVECEFDFEFDDEMLLITKFPTIMSMVEYIESKVNLLIF